MATFVEIQLKKENLEDVFMVPELGCPNWYNSLPINLYVIVQIIFLQTDSLMVQWPRVLGNGFPNQVSQV